MFKKQWNNKYKPVKKFTFKFNDLNLSNTVKINFIDFNYSQDLVMSYEKWNPNKSLLIILLH